ncbi:MAG: hypothetical protein M0Z85_03675 [Gammaproteobacteria bacterium]|nr:hypothetical protein [Gammaproteobacteria bacterium]
MMKSTIKIPTFASFSSLEIGDFYVVPKTRFWTFIGRIYWVCTWPASWNHMRIARARIREMFRS